VKDRHTNSLLELLENKQEMTSQKLSFMSHYETHTSFVAVLYLTLLLFHFFRFL